FIHNDIEIIKELLKNPAIDLNRNDDWDALMNTTGNNRLKIVEIVLARQNIDSDIQNKLRNTALLTASRYGYFEVVKALLTHPNINPNVQYLYKYAALITASRHGYFEVVKALLTHPN